MVLTQSFEKSENGFKRYFFSLINNGVFGVNTMVRKDRELNEIKSQLSFRNTHVKLIPVLSWYELLLLLQIKHLCNYFK